MTTASLYPAIRPTLDLNFAAAETLDPRITFSRASTGTYYDGKTVVKAEENLFLYSQEFDNAFWTKNESTVTANNQTAPDGTSTAETMTENTSNSLHRVFGQITSTAITYTASCFFKAGTRSWAYIRMIDSGGVGRNAFFNLSSGVLGTVDSGMSATITSVGNGWYRCSTVLTAAIAGTNAISLGMSSADNTISYTGDGTSTLLLWGAQLEQRSTVTAYTPTTTAPITNYIPALQTAAANVARFDHDPVTGESKGLLIEEQRTNLLTYSEQFDNAAWSKLNSSITSNTIVAPDGTLTGDMLFEDTTNNQHFTRQVFSATSGTTYTLSVFAKNNNRFLLLYFTPNATFGGSGAGAYFNLATGVVGNTFGTVTTSITSVGNGWYRCIISAAATSTGSANAVIGLSASGTVSTYTGDGYSGLYIWGAQLEAGSFPTSYIPTVASQVTRSADSASMTGSNFSSWYRADTGTIYSEHQVPASTANYPYAVIISNGSSTNHFGLLFNTNGASRFERIASGTVAGSLNVTTGVPAGSFVKQVADVSTNDFAMTANGAAVVTSTSGAVPIVSQLNIGATYIGGLPLNGCIKRIAYYPARLTNAQLQALTS